MCIDVKNKVNRFRNRNLNFKYTENEIKSINQRLNAINKKNKADALLEILGIKKEMKTK